MNDQIISQDQEDQLPIQVQENGITYTIQTDEYGDQRWFVGLKCFRYVHVSGSIHHYGHGVEGEHHQESNDEPSILYANGDRMFYSDGMKHRANDLPARVFADGEQHWYEWNKRHRVLGPAVIPVKGKAQYWFEGEKIQASSQEEFELAVNEILAERSKEEKKRERQEKKKLGKLMEEVDETR